MKLTTNWNKLYRQMVLDKQPLHNTKPARKKPGLKRMVFCQNRDRIKVTL